MEDNNHTQIDLLKLDIEGAEIKVLEKNVTRRNLSKVYLC